MLMDNNTSPTPAIDEIIRERRLTAYFQPIVSIIQNKVCGVEGLIRGVDAVSNRTIPPGTLFEVAHTSGITLELDRICREKVLDTYRDILPYNNDLILFLNIDASIIEKVVGSNVLINLVQARRLNPRNIVIEVNETKVQNTAALKQFIDVYRNYGFLIALDDVGAGFSNLDRIPLAKPDIIKIDMSLIRNIHQNYYKQEVFKSLAGLANQIGALIVAEGVETTEEAIQVMELGGHMIQGYYFAEPQKIEKDLPVSIREKIRVLSESFKNYTGTAIKQYKQRLGELEIVVERLVAELAGAAFCEFNAKLGATLVDNPLIECCYILDEHGIQATDTLCSDLKNSAKTGLLFCPARMGTDHSMKKYYYYLNHARLEKYLTEPYISLATGNRCITFSKTFLNSENQKYILCMDFKCEPQGRA